MNKTDLVPKTTAQLLVGAIQEKYPTTLVLTSSFGVVPLNAVLAASTDDRFGCVDAGITRHKHAVTRDTLDKTTTSDSHDAHSHDHGHDHDSSDCAECKCDPRSTSSHLVDDGFVSVRVGCAGHPYCDLSHHPRGWMILRWPLRRPGHWWRGSSRTSCATTCPGRWCA